MKTNQVGVHSVFTSSPHFIFQDVYLDTDLGNEHRIGYGQVAMIAHECEFYISSDVWIMDEHRGKGYGQDAHRHRLTYLREQGVSSVICIVAAGNQRQIHILEKFGWKEIQKLPDDRRLYYKDLFKDEDNLFQE